ncbi:MAG: hypothetical protein ACD_3C00066G0007, partial [uncultured bacterium (gcode 4)]
LDLLTRYPHMRSYAQNVLTYYRLMLPSWAPARKYSWGAECNGFEVMETWMENWTDKFH